MWNAKDLIGSAASPDLQVRSSFQVLAAPLVTSNTRLQPSSTWANQSPLSTSQPSTTAPFSPPPHRRPAAAALATVAEIHSAFKTFGLFLLTESPTPSLALTTELSGAFAKFYALPQEDKRALDLRNGGWAWRGYMPFGGEGTKDKTDLKEGFYGGPEHTSHELGGLPTYGLNQFPDAQVPELRELVLDFTERITELGVVVCEAMTIALKLERGYIKKKILDKPNPVQLFRCFHYIAADDAKGGQFGIGEHSDFGLLTLLAQNGPGLQVLSPGGKWLDVPVIPGSFVVNVGDILDRLTSGLYVSPFHRAIPPAPGTDRISIPFFFDPAWNAEMVPFPLPPTTKSQIPEDAEKRWTRTTFRNLEGVWGQYLGVKVRKVFPDLVLPEFTAVARESTLHKLAVPQNAAPTIRGAIAV
ncbi:Clavaminate synthase-like protein [Athelia psychrophila]|uniref:Clavaminate synthase-like protein n=1 Tax=Athelia psychrophila TaxID=1759441 RepID=A0A167XJJ5_9AGAM|nr:Clavaminate synthase-like protein [Fibularhizoctonia sp. CBS 109695]